MWTLHHGDALGPGGLPSLADGTADVCITDPPFDERTHASALELGDWRDGGRAVSGALPFAPLAAEGIAAAAREIVRVTRRWILVMCADRQIEAWATALESAGGRFVRVGVAVRNNPRPQMSGDRPAPPADWIVIAHARPGRMHWNGGGHAAIWTAPAVRWDPGGQVHPTQKPVALMSSLVEAFSDRGELVLDPFAGVASTGVAAVACGRRFLGWELDAGYVAAGRARLKGSREQLGLALG